MTSRTRSIRGKVFCATIGLVVCGTTACSVQDAGDARKDAAAGDGAQDSAQSRCVPSVAQWCGQGSCLMNWPSNVKSFCAIPHGGVSAALGCDGYNIFREMGVDMASEYYYDSTSSQLVAIITFNANERTETCVGPADFMKPSCSGDRFMLTQIDCSNDGGNGG